MSRCRFLLRWVDDCVIVVQSQLFDSRVRVVHSMVGVAFQHCRLHCPLLLQSDTAGGYFHCKNSIIQKFCPAPADARCDSCRHGYTQSKNGQASTFFGRLWASSRSLLAVPFRCDSRRLAKPISEMCVRPRPARRSFDLVGVALASADFRAARSLAGQVAIVTGRCFPVLNY